MPLSDRLDSAEFVVGPEAAAFLARASGLDASHMRAYIALINGLVADGIWSKFDAVYVYAQGGQARAA